MELEFLKRKTVTGVSVGTKKVKGKDTGELAIVVYVAKKKEEKDLAKSEIIPGMVDEIKTDVVERNFVLHSLQVRIEDVSPMKDTGKYDPLIGGISIGPCKTFWMEPPDVPTAGWYKIGGTFGAVVQDDASGKKMLLSNYHVMCVDDKWQVGDKMSQPGLNDGGICPSDVVGELQRAALTSAVDAAVCSHAARPIVCMIKDIGGVSGTATGALGMAVRKRGRTTGLTYGKIVSTTLAVKIYYGKSLGYQILTNQLDIENDKSKNAIFGDHGDSGSVVVNDENEVVGLHFAGDGVNGVANPIQAVLQALNVKICQSIFKIDPNKLIKDFSDNQKMTKDLSYLAKYINDHHWYKYPPGFHPPIGRAPSAAETTSASIEQRLANLESMIFAQQGYVPKVPKISDKFGKHEHKEVAWEKGPYIETGMLGANPSSPQSSQLTSIPLEERLGRLENAIGLMNHFISAEMRPSLDMAALYGEPEFKGRNPEELTKLLQDQAAEAKRYWSTTYLPK